MHELVDYTGTGDLRIDVLGTNPEREATALHELCTRAMPDEAVMREFSATVNAYAGSSHEAAVERIRAKYGGVRPAILCGIVRIDGVPDGMVFMGMMDYMTVDGISGSGINSSVWLLRRGRGVGKWAVAALGGLIEQKRGDPLDPLFEADHWTAIRRGNTASERLAYAYRFVRIGACAERYGYDIYRK